MATPEEQREALIRLTAQHVGLLKTIQGVIGQINAKLSAAKGGGGKSGPGPKKTAEEAGGALAAVKGVAGTVMKSLGIASAVVGGFVAALTAVPLAIAGVVSASRKYVEALSPSQVQQYDRAQANLSATIGYGLTPIIAYATRTLREWAGALLPAMQQIRPVIDRISNAVGGAASALGRLIADGVRRAATGLAMMLPTIEKLASTFAALIDIVTAANEAFDAAGGQSLFEGVRMFWRETVDQFRRLTTAIAILIARILKFAGETGALRTFRESLQRSLDARNNPASGLTAAPSGATTGGIEDVLKRLNERAFIATTTTGTQKTETEFLESLLDQVQKIEKDPRTWEQVITRGVKAAFFGGKPEGGAATGAGDASAGGSPGFLGMLKEGLTTGSIPIPWRS